MTENDLQAYLRSLPGVDQLLQSEAMSEALEHHPRSLVLKAIRQVLEEKRREILDRPQEAAAARLDQDHLLRLCIRRLEELNAFTLRPVVNATGIIVHTNLGRSLLPESAIGRLARICSGYNNLEYDLERGRRGSRHVHAEQILCEITGARAALVVNNNASAVLLALATIAKDREVIVSRGQMVEIGGSFRIPDVMAAGGALLREVGCTNRTHLRDYEAAINERTALLLKVHCSNYRVVGFTKEVSLDELVRLGRQFNLPVMEDLGSGSFIDVSRYGLAREPTVREVVATGVDIVTFSGDKLLGGPQAGVILGNPEIIAKCKKNPLTRALRVDKMTLAALETTLRLYRDERRALEQIPTLRMISLPLPVVKQRAEQLARSLQGACPGDGWHIDVEDGVSQVGGGSLPAQDLPSALVAVQSRRWSAARLERALRSSDPPVIGRIEAERFLLDVRTLQPGDDEIIVAAFERLARTGPGSTA